MDDAVWYGRNKVIINILTCMSKQIFINLPVKDLNITKEFFSKLGFTFNPQFTDEKSACMIISDNIFAMLLVEEFFQTFTKKEIIDATKNVEVINAIAVGSKEEVKELANKAFAAGGVKYKEPKDHGWMYEWGFQDLDGHIWELFYADVSKAPEQPGENH